MQAAYKGCDVVIMSRIISQRPCIVTINILPLDVEQVIQLNVAGFLQFPKWRAEQTTISLAHSIGKVVDLEALMPGADIPTVQRLEPRNTAEVARNKYSGVFGLEEFPLHTDLAQWAFPPRYLLLRCVQGAKEVSTRLLPLDALSEELDKATLKRALVRSRNPDRNGRTSIQSVLTSTPGCEMLRWDPLFLVPMNEAGRTMARIMQEMGSTWRGIVEIYLADKGDLVVIDNWRMLHGRSSVKALDRRIIERVYLSELI